MATTKIISQSLVGLTWRHLSVRLQPKAYRPIYTATSRHQGLLSNYQNRQPTSARFLTNTTSNTYAPNVVIATSKPANNVYDDTSDHLPSLPVPNLNETLDRLKETIWPVAMNSQEFAKALHLIEAFAGSAGQKLDLLLRAKASQTKNWLSHDWWIEEAYLKSRLPLVINSNPALIYPQLPFEVTNQRQFVTFCAQLVSSIIDCKLALQRGWNPEQIGGKDNQQQLDPTLCYDQYRRIFASTRLPGEHMDTFKSSEFHENELGFNIICSLRGKFYEIRLDNVANEQGRVEALESVFSKIISNTPRESDAIGAGILTTMRRDLWAKCIKEIEPSSLEAIEDAHLMLCLDTLPCERLAQDTFVRPLLNGVNQTSEADGEYLGALSRQVLHGDRTNVGNRWFDKSLQLIVVADDECSRLLGAGINYEHCIAEAIVMTKILEYSYAKLIQQHKHMAMSATSGSSAPVDSTATWRQLKMPIAEGQLGAVMQRAKQDFVSHIEQFDLVYFEYQNYGRDQIKSWSFSPDSWFQVSLQLAHYQLHGRLSPCYESASTRRFAYGRTDTIRSLTKDVAQFCFEPNYETLLAAINSHKSYALAANAGSAIDRVLLGYRMVFNELKTNQWAWGLPTFNSSVSDENNATTTNDFETNRRQLKFNSLADTMGVQQVDLNDLFTEEELNILSAFFNNELFERVKRFTLATSQVSSLEHPRICTSYGPSVPDGYACCYNLSQQQIAAAITANSSNQSFSCEAGRFSESLRDSLDKMREIVVESRQQQQQQQHR